MKPSSIYIALHVVAVALGAPVPPYQFHNLDVGALVPSRPPSAAPATPETARPRWRHGYPKLAPEVLILGGDVPFDSRPWSPSQPAEPARERLLTTSHLLSHQLNTNTAPAEQPDHRRDDPKDAADQQRRLDLEADSVEFEISDMDMGIAIPSRLGTPCRYARLSRERNDVLVVLLAVAFLLVVLVVEAWATICQRLVLVLGGATLGCAMLTVESSARQILGWQGVIRLEDDDTDQPETWQRQPLSIQACGELIQPVEDEKLDYEVVR